jgi:hypothetical protein
MVNPFSCGQLVFDGGGGLWGPHAWSRHGPATGSAYAPPLDMVHSTSTQNAPSHDGTRPHARHIPLLEFIALSPSNEAWRRRRTLRYQPPCRNAHMTLIPSGPTARPPRARRSAACCARYPPDTAYPNLLSTQSKTFAVTLAKEIVQYIIVAETRGKRRISLKCTLESPSEASLPLACTVATQAFC